MDDLIQEFIAEASEGLTILDGDIVRLEQEPNDPKLLGSIFRVMHTIKGTCGFLGLARLGHVAHAAENILGKFRDGEMQVTPEAVGTILQAIDRIKELVGHLEESGQEQEGDDSALIKALDRLAGIGEAEEELDEMERLFRDTPCLVDMTPVNPVPAPMAEPVAEATPEPKTETTPAAPAKTADAKPADDHAKGGAAAQNIRVRLDVLETMMQLTSELVLTRNQLLQMARQVNNNEMTTPLQRLNHITSELQESVMQTRMQPVGNVWTQFPRLVRDLSIDLGKKIELEMVGKETELDRQLLEMIKDPLTHMVRNSVDHGMEMPAERVAAGKPETGTVTLKAYHEGGHIIIEIKDDGRGLNVDRIRSKILQNNLASADELASMTNQQAMQYIFRPGFSTAEKVTSVSGRGVGMDVVGTNIEKIGGTIELFSEQGKGTTFRIKIPLTLAIVSILIVEASSHRLAIPQVDVVELVQITKSSEHKIEYIDEEPVLRLRGKLLPMIPLPKLLGCEDANAERKDTGFIVVCRTGSTEYGVVVDRIYDTEEIVVQPVVPMLQNAEIYAGCTILGDGSVIMILDTNKLAKNTADLSLHHAKEDAKQVRKGFAQTTQFLVFHSQSATPCAVSLELVSRLEQISVSHIEYSAGTPVVQYRDGLMQLISLDGSFRFEGHETVPAIVFNATHTTLGLVINSIADISTQPMDLLSSSSDPRFLGSMIINGETTDILDVGYLFQKIQHFAGKETVTSGSASMAGHHKPSLLLVDDSAFYRNVTAPLLSAAGYDIITADSAAEAFRFFEEDLHFDLIISDIEMPDMNGFEFADACLHDNRLKHIPLIAYTSKVTPEAKQKGMNSGFKDYVSKSDRDGLMQAIACHIAPSLTKEQHV
jgi:two-component system chemotaxis sensor kinase CheA